LLFIPTNGCSHTAHKSVMDWVDDPSGPPEVQPFSMQQSKRPLFVQLVRHDQQQHAKDESLHQVPELEHSESSSSIESMPSPKERAHTPMFSMQLSMRRRREPRVVDLRSSDIVSGASMPLTPRPTCTACLLPVGRGREKFHKSVCEAVARIRVNPRARHRARVGSSRYYSTDVLQHVTTTLISYASSPASSVPIDTVAGALLSLKSDAAEKEVLSTLGDSGGVEKLLRPFFIERLRAAGMDVHRNDDESVRCCCLEVTLHIVDSEHAILADDAITRYEDRLFQSRRRTMSHVILEARAPPSIVFQCRTATDLAHAYWRARNGVTGLDMSYTPIGNDVPVAMRAFENLKFFFAQMCNLRCFDGMLPIRNLRTLNLSDNHIEQVPSTLAAACPLLEQIVLSRNRIERLLASSIVGLQSLHTLRLSSNGLVYLPVEALAALPRLANLDCGCNRLKSFPLALGSSRTLERVDLASNDPKFEVDECSILREALVRVAVVLR
jgi:hypothetical protein